MFILAFFLFFFFNDTATTEIYTLSLHDALPISAGRRELVEPFEGVLVDSGLVVVDPHTGGDRSEEHTSELQSQSNIVCRLLLEKKKKKQIPYHIDRQQNNNVTYICITSDVT